MKVVVKNNVAKFRRDKGLKQKDIAEKSGVSVPTLRAVEHNIFSSSLGTLIKIANALGVDVKELFEDASNFSTTELEIYESVKMINELKL